MLGRRTAGELRDPRAWGVGWPRWFRAVTGPGSALEPLAEWRGPVGFTLGPHLHCVSAPVPPPPGYESHRRLALQPKGYGSCLRWFTVDLFVSRGAVEAVTVDVWEP